jgi:hypothetical protein
MPLITRVKQAITQLDGGAFQVLCDDWLSRRIGGAICSFGTQTGTTKTTKGTPDSYFRTYNGHYIFVEYTTQTSGLPNKIRADLVKCIDESKTGIRYTEVDKIIYCHTSSNLSAKQDAELHAICSDVGIELELYGIDAIAVAIAKSFPGIAKDHLDIQFDTGQISSIDNYLKDHDSNKMMAPLELEFHCREKELKQIAEAFLQTNVVILMGNPGVGKTSIAIEFARQYSTINSVEVRIIHDRQLPLYDDIKSHFSDVCPYFIIVDDANQVAQLFHVLDLLKNGNVKILITVREYAKGDVLSQAKQISSPDVVAIESFTDDEIKKIVQGNLGIKNNSYLKRIVDIADGNARLAILAGKLAVEQNSLESIADVSSLYEEYYGQILERMKSDGTDNDMEMLVAGILSFFETMHESQIEKLLTVLPDICLDKGTCIRYINKLSEKEIVNIYYDRAFEVADHVFGNFILKYVLIDKKLIPLSDVVRGGFAISRSRTINAINMLLKVFSTDETHEYVKKQLKSLWEELRSGSLPDFIEFVKSAFAVNPTETLLVLKELIDATEEHNVRLRKEGLGQKGDVVIINDDILEIIGGLVRQHLEIQSVTELFIEYFCKRPDLYEQFFDVIEQCFTVNSNSDRFGYDVQIKLLKAVFEKADNWKNNNVSLLFLEIAKELLQYTFTPIESGREKTITFYTVSLTDSEGCRAYRSLVLSGLDELICRPEYRDEVMDVLLKVFSYHPQAGSKEVALFDAKNIEKFFCKLSPKKLQHSVLASKFIQWIRNIDLSYNVSFLNAYMENPRYQMIKMLERDRKSFVRSEQEIEERKAAIQPFVNTAGIKELKQLIDTCAEYASFTEDSTLDICVGLDILLDALYEKDVSVFLDAIKYYLEKDTPFYLYSEKLIRNLRQIIGDAELFSLLKEDNEYSARSSWLYLYFFTLNKDEIKQIHVDEWYAYIGDDSLQSVRYQGIAFLTNFSSVDADIILNTCERLLHHKVNPEMRVVDFCSNLIDACEQSVYKIIDIFNKRLDLLTELYLTILKTEQNGSFDYEGKLFVALVCLHAGFLHKYVEYSDSRIIPSLSN